jgi:sporulation integral membrane protein YlbJ
MRFHGGKNESRQAKKKHAFLLKEALRVLHLTRLKNNKPIGMLLGDAVMSAIQTLLMIGGFIILFSVLNKLLFLLHITPFLGILAGQLLSIIHFSEQLSIPIISGLFEMTLGSRLISEVQESSLLQQVITASFIIGFGGFSVQAQVASILAQTDIRFKPFFIARILHGFISAVITWAIWKPVYMHLLKGGEAEQTAFAYIGKNAGIYGDAVRWLEIYGPPITIFGLILYMILYYFANRSRS